MNLARTRGSLLLRLCVVTILCTIVSFTFSAINPIQAGPLSKACAVILARLEQTIRLRPFARTQTVSVAEIGSRSTQLQGTEVEFYRLGRGSYVVVTVKGTFLFEPSGNKRAGVDPANDTFGYFRIKPFEARDVGVVSKIFRSLTSSIPGERKTLPPSEYKILDDAISQNQSTDFLLENALSDGLNKVFTSTTPILYTYLYSKTGVISRLPLTWAAVAGAVTLFTPQPFGSPSPYFQRTLGPVPKLAVSSIDRMFEKANKDPLNFELDQLERYAQPGKYVFDYSESRKFESSQSPKWYSSPSLSELRKRNSDLEEINQALHSDSVISAFLRELSGAKPTSSSDGTLYFPNTLAAHFQPSKAFWKSDQRVQLPSKFVTKILNRPEVRQNPNFLDTLVNLYASGMKAENQASVIGDTVDAYLRGRAVSGWGDGKDFVALIVDGLSTRSRLTPAEMDVLKNIAATNIPHASQKATLEIARRLSPSEATTFLEEQLTKMRAAGSPVFLSMALRLEGEPSSKDIAKKSQRSNSQPSWMDNYPYPGQSVAFTYAEKLLELSKERGTKAVVDATVDDVFTPEQARRLFEIYQVENGTDQIADTLVNHRPLGDFFSPLVAAHLLEGNLISETRSQEVSKRSVEWLQDIYSSEVFDANKLRPEQRHAIVALQGNPTVLNTIETQSPNYRDRLIETRIQGILSGKKDYWGETYDEFGLAAHIVKQPESGQIYFRKLVQTSVQDPQIGAIARELRALAQLEFFGSNPKNIEDLYAWTRLHWSNLDRYQQTFFMERFLVDSPLNEE